MKTLTELQKGEENSSNEKCHFLNTQLESKTVQIRLDSPVSWVPVCSP